MVQDGNLQSRRLYAIDALDDAIADLSTAIELCEQVATVIEHRDDMAFRCSANRLRLEICKIRETKTLLEKAKIVAP
jgi:hypothetical protein